MKVRLPHPFFIYASQFTMESMIYSTCYWAKEIAFNTKNANFGFSGEVKYTVDLNNKPFSQKCNIVQTWLIDMLYHIICKCRYGHKEIGKDESLHLIALYNDYADDLDAEYLKKDEDAILYVMGFFGEQSRIQGPSLFFEEFSREKYILETISYRVPPEKSFGIDVKPEFYGETHYTTDEYSALLLLIWGLFSQTMLVVNQRELDRMVKYKNPILSNANVLDVISKNSITIDEIRNSPLGRQVFYSKPIIKIGDDYIASNPYLMLALFTNSNYWVLRNKYRDLRSQNFTNAFGNYYEIYLEEVLSNCLTKDCFQRIEEDPKEKRADWHIKFGNYHFFVEQKSSLSLLGIKHSHPDVKAMKKYMMDNWGEAINQLNTTQRFYNTQNAIKIILVYEDYYKSKCLDELFRLHPELGNDNHFWLVSINEFETLMQLCKSNPEMALQIIQEKDQIETGRSIVEVGPYAFAKCSSLVKVIISDNVSTFGEYAFYWCSELTTVELSANSKLTSISKSMFHWCEKLSSVTIPSGVTRIENYAFYGCDILTSITIPSRVTYIGDSAFSNKGLKSITIPVSVKTIDRAAFCNCTSLTTFNYAGTKTQWNGVTKGNQWADYSAFSKVNCSNGTVSI